jgi:hypothetical protein
MPFAWCPGDDAADLAAAGATAKKVRVRIVTTVFIVSSLDDPVPTTRN